MKYLMAWGKLLYGILLGKEIAYHNMYHVIIYFGEKENACVQGTQILERY